MGTHPTNSSIFICFSIHLSVVEVLVHVVIVDFRFFCIIFCSCCF